MSDKNFLIVGKYGSYYVEAEDFSEAADKAYDNHCGYRNVIAIIALPDKDGDG